MANKILNQILKNQAIILLSLSEMNGTWNVKTLNSISDRIKETMDTLVSGDENE